MPYATPVPATCQSMWTGPAQHQSVLSAQHAYRSGPDLDLDLDLAYNGGEGTGGGLSADAGVILAAPSMVWL